MRFVVSHVGFIKGQPPRYRHVGEMQVRMGTSVEIRKVSPTNAPIVYLHEDVANPSIEYRFHDGSFYRLSDHLKLNDARNGTISVERLEQQSQLRRYEDRCNWRAFASNGIGTRGTLAAPRSLHEWKATKIDVSDAGVFSDAVTALAENFIVIDNAIWERCFEPCLEVRWTPSVDGAHVWVKTSIGYIGGDQNPVDYTGAHPLDRSAYDWLGRHQTANEHLRCFSALEPERVSAFIDGLKEGVANFRDSRNTGQKLKVVEPSLASTDFDALELRRSALVHIAAVRAMNREVNDLMATRRANVIFGQDDFGARSDRLETLLARHEAGDAPPEDVLDAMRELRKALQYTSKAFEGRYKISLATFVPPEYFGDLDSFAVDLDIYAATAMPPPGKR
ncbi:hypothetical protein HFO56_33765 [Rhizobium laguerreae]|uniref:hypothetical protein n=1 Tax=Rhizobium laguerreae TaxID=1076926 RepID=UPI001C924F57|nr:hypothetical protein [Rhizobium laguerreae]MBY3157295.1 hypothetical protein [Rhizobium laguerreae]